ncbi:MAG: T9SS type A sorting domain-containing protein [Chitinophagales bacterium]|nr:T9SS type A sorting domain-containing protein [Chitinophagales bacterium]
MKTLQTHRLFFGFKTTLLSLCLSFASNSFAQQSFKHCGTDEISYQLYADNPQLQQAMEHNRIYLKKFTEQFVAEQQNRSNDSLYTIPVVFHVIHAYGNENISDEQIMSGLYVLNRNFALQHPDTANIVSAFKPIAANCDIEFKLAKIDPNGNCTNGINRIASTLTKIGDHSVKNLIHWNPSKYLNVYVVRSIANLAGHCLMPDQADAKPEWDGIVIDHTYMGNTGTANEARSVVMAHEAGHYLNLFHIWGGNNVPGYFYQPVGQTANCLIGDDVQDTPETIGWSNCNLSNASCDNAVDNVQNAMDYSYCNWMFTQGQRQRMRAALNSPVANRNNLITAGNLAATGVNLNTVCKASFTVSRKNICPGDTVIFTDKSVATPDTWLWNFGDGETSTAQHPQYMYYWPGTYYVTLTASKGGSAVTSDTIQIRVNAHPAMPYFVEGFESGTMTAWGLLNESDNDSLLFTAAGNNSGYNSNKAAVIRMNDTTATYSGRTVLHSPSIDLSALGATQFSLRYACSQKKQNNDDVLEVFTSTDCGKTWISKGKRLGANLRTVTSPQTNPDWTPTDSTQWKTYSFSLLSNQLSSSFMFRIDYISFYTNAFFIDDININAEAYNSVPKLQLENVNIVPNPAQNYFELTGDFDAVDLQMLDVNGRSVLRRTSVNNGDKLDIVNLPSGVYFIRLENENSYCIKKLLK